MDDVKREVTPEERREHVLANISEDVAALLRERCVELGRLQLHKEVSEDPEWTSWRYNPNDEQPMSAEEYALGNSKGSGALKKVPNWASKKAVFDFLRPEFERDYDEYVEMMKEKGKWPEEADGE